MKSVYHILDKNNIQALAELSNENGFSYPLTKETAKIYCAGRAPRDAGVQTYGVFAEDRLVSVMTATFLSVFPCKDSPSGRIVHISGAYTLPEYRHRNCATDLVKMIESDAERFGADYLCCDSIADDLYLKNGFSPTPDNETRMWKPISAYKEDNND